MSSKTSFESNLRRAANAISQETPPLTLRERIQNELPESPRPAWQHQFVTRLAVATTICAVLIGIASLSATRPQKLYAAEMRQAIEKAQTWHFSGWRLENGKRVRWEVWGRRQPFFYREQLGEKSILDDGTKRTYILPPSETEGRKHGIYLIQPTQASDAQKQIEARNATAGFLAGLGEEDRDFGGLRPSADGSDLASTTQKQMGGMPIIAEVTTLHANKRTFLPTQYSVDRKEYARKITDSLDIPEGPKPIRAYRQAQLDAEYDIPLPANLDAKQVPPAYTTVDLTTPTPIATNGRNIALSNGITIAAEIDGRDTAGNMHLRFRAWVGGRPYDFRDHQVDLEMPLYYADAHGVTRHRAQDNRGNAYIDLGYSLTEIRNPNRPGLWIAPLEPLSEKTDAPQELTVNVWFQLSASEFIGSGVVSVPIARTETLTFHLPIPRKTIDLHYDNQGGRKGDDYRGVPNSILLEAAEKRGSYYMRGAPWRGELYAPTDDRWRSIFQHQLKWQDRANYWYGIAETEAARTHNPMMQKIAQKNQASLRQQKERTQEYIRKLPASK